MNKSQVLNQLIQKSGPAAHAATAAFLNLLARIIARYHCHIDHPALIHTKPPFSGESHEHRKQQ